MSVAMQSTAQVTPKIYFSESAKKHLLAYLDKQKQYLGVRLSVKKTGCSGLSYVVDYVSEPLDTDLKMPLTAEYSVWIDKGSYPFLHEMSVDYIKQGLNFKFVFNNPNQTGQCGCGESFTVS